jgi:hypothetical protein
MKAWGVIIVLCYLFFFKVVICVRRWPPWSGGNGGRPIGLAYQDEWPKEVNSVL